MYNKVGSESSTEHQDLLSVLTKHVKKIVLLSEGQFKVEVFICYVCCLSCKTSNQGQEFAIWVKNLPLWTPTSNTKVFGFECWLCSQSQLPAFCSGTPWETIGDDSRSWACPPSEKPGLSPRLWDSAWSSTSCCSLFRSTIFKVNRIGNLSFYQLQDRGGREKLIFFLFLKSIWNMQRLLLQTLIMVSTQNQFCATLRFRPRVPLSGDPLCGAIVFIH